MTRLRPSLKPTMRLRNINDAGLDFNTTTRRRRWWYFCRRECRGGRGRALALGGAGGVNTTGRK